MTNFEKILEAMKESRCNYFGVRGDDIDLEVGQELDASFDWDYENDIASTEKLNGTCAVRFGYLWFDGESEDIEEIQKAVEFATRNYHYKNFAIIGGDACEDGADEAEIIIQDATVIAVL